MATAWPTLPGLSPQIEVEYVPTNSEFPADDGSCVVVNRGTTRRRYTFRYNYLKEGVAAPNPYTGYDQPAVLDYLIGLASVTSGQFTFADPFSAGTITARIAEPPRMTKDESGIFWTAQITFITDP